MIKNANKTIACYAMLNQSAIINKTSVNKLKNA